MKTRHRRRQARSQLRNERGQFMTRTSSNVTTSITTSYFSNPQPHLPAKVDTLMDIASNVDTHFERAVSILYAEPEIIPDSDAETEVLVIDD